MAQSRRRASVRTVFWVDFRFFSAIRKDYSTGWQCAFFGVGRVHNQFSPLIIFVSKCIRRGYAPPKKTAGEHQLVSFSCYTWLLYCYIFPLFLVYLMISIFMAPENDSSLFILPVNCVSCAPPAVSSDIITGCFDSPQLVNSFVAHRTGHPPTYRRSISCNG